MNWRKAKSWRVKNKIHNNTMLRAQWAKRATANFVFNSAIRRAPNGFNHPVLPVIDRHPK